MAKPKVVSLLKDRSLQQCFPQLSLMGRPKNIFVECQTYDLILQVESAASSNLDIFEDAILKMISIQVHSAEQLAERLCLPVDLVKLIILRLQEKGYLMNAHTLSVQGSDALRKTDKQNSAHTSLLCKLFVIPQAGLILPYISIGELQTADVVDAAGGITLEFGSRGEPRTVSGKYLRCPPAPPKRLSQNECVKAIQRYNRQAAARSLPQINMLQNWAIDSTSGERVYFHFQTGILKGSSDFTLISDGFVQNVDGLSAYLDEMNPDILQSVRQDAATLPLNRASETAAYRMSGKYGEVSSRLAALERKLRVVDQRDSDNSTRDEQLEASQSKEDIIRDCAIMLEWAFYYYSVEHPVSSLLRRELINGYGSSNVEMIVRLAQKAGIPHADKLGHLVSGVSAGRLQRMEQSGKPDFFINFPLAVAQAGESGGGPVQRLLSENPEILQFLDLLFSKYPSLRHGGQNNLILPDARSVIAQSRLCVNTLFPELMDAGAAGDPAPVSLIDASDKRLTARVSLELEMGSMYFNSLPDYVQNDWMRISPDKTGTRLPEPFDFVNTLYRLLEDQLQVYLALKAVGRSPLVVHAAGLTEAEGKTLAAQRWGTALPKSLATVSARYFENAQLGKKASLGGYVLYSLCVSDDAEIPDLQKLGFVNCADQILTMRGHGNNVGLFVEEADLARLRAQVMQVSKYLGGY